MKKNIGTLDRIIRIIAGSTLIVIAIIFKTTLAIVGGALGGIMVVTALIGFCPPYALLGISTCEKK